MLRVVLASVCASTLVSVLSTLIVVSLVSPPSAEAQTQVITARGFRVVDAQNQTLAVLGPLTAGGPGLVLYEGQEQARTVIRNGSLTFLDAQDIERGVYGTGGIVAYDSQGNLRFTLQVGLNTYLMTVGPRGDILWASDTP